MRHRVRHARVHAARLFADVAREKWRPAKFKKCFDAFDSLLKAFISVGIFLKYFRHKLLQFEQSKTIFCMSRFRSLTKLSSAASFTRAPQHSTLSFTYVED